MDTTQSVLLEIESGKETAQGSICKEKDTKNTSSVWIPYRDVLINSQYFKHGLVLLSPKHLNSVKTNQKSNSFFIKDREFFFYIPTISDDTMKKSSAPDIRSAKKAKVLLSTLINFASINPVSIKSFGEESAVLFNKRHREEIFLPIVFDKKDKNVGLYFYPWISKSTNNFKFSGFTQYVTAGCLFGSSLKAMNQNGAVFELIKHDREFYDGEKITLIVYNPEAPSPYEQMLFSEFEKQCLLIDSFSKPGQSKNLLFHLPYYDYALFGVELFIRGRMSFEALDSFFKTIFAKRDEYISKINEVCKRHNITVQVESPFDNLFGCVTNNTNITEFILSKLNLASKELGSHVEISAQQENEKKLVQYCLNQLQTNRYNEDHRLVWQDSLKLESESIVNLEQLFKIANANMIAIGSKGKHEYETCSLLPLSEKQIQVTYDSFSKKASKELTSYPPVFNLTTFEPLLTYSPTTKGLLFYFSHCQESLVKLISDKKILETSYENVGLFSNKVKQKLSQQNASSEPSNNVKSIRLEDVLNSSKSRIS